MLLEFQNKTIVEIIWFWLMNFGLTLDSSDIDLWDIDLLNAHFDLSDTDNSSEHFVDIFKICLQDDFKTFLQVVLKTSSA